MTAANDNGAVRGLVLPAVDLGAGFRGADAAAVVRGGGVDHGCVISVQPVAASSGKSLHSTGGNLRPVPADIEAAFLTFAESFPPRGSIVDRIA